MAMQLTFPNPGPDYAIDSIMGFQQGNESAFWSEPLYHFYPQIDRSRTMAMTCEDRRRYIADALTAHYRDVAQTIDEKYVRYAAHWEQHREQVEAALSEAFDVPCVELLNDMRCFVTLNSVMPRCLTQHTFDVFYLSSERGALGLALHEIVHLVWFYVWHDEFGDDWNDYEAPSLPWIFSEMVVESVMRDARLSSINPYFPRENGGCVYPYFFTMQTSDGPALNVLDRLYRARPIRAFMRDGYAWCQAHEQEIRAHIAKAEAEG